MITKNILKKYFFDFADNHYQIKSKGYGDLHEISITEGVEYPLLWITPNPCTVAGNEISYNYNILVADRLLDGNSNIIEGESDTFQICLDVLASLQNNNEFDWELESNATISPFHDRFKDRVVGNFMTVSFKSPFNYDECSIPKSGSPEPPPSDCSAAVVRVNSVFYGTVLNGEDGNVVVKDTNGDIVGELIGGEWIVPYSDTCEPATAVIKNSAGTNLKSESIDSGSSENITINDSTAVIKDSAGTTIRTESILAEASENITITDSTAVIKNSAGTTLKTDMIKAQNSKNITVNDGSAVIKNSAGTTLKTQAILAEGTQNITINDSTALVKNSENTTIASATDILAEGSKNISVADTPYTVKDQGLNVLATGNLVSVKTGQVINVTCNVTAQTTDRYGISLPNVVLDQSNPNLNWNTYDFTPLALSREVSWGGFNTALQTAATSLMSAGLWQKLTGWFPNVGGTADCHRWNFRYPYNDNRAQRMLYNLITHSSLGLGGFDGFHWVYSQFNVQSLTNTYDIAIGVTLTSNLGSSLGTTKMIFNATALTGTSANFVIDLTTGNIGYTLFNGSATYVPGAPEVDYTGFRYVIKKEGASLKLFINGSLVQTTTPSFSLQISSYMINNTITFGGQGYGGIAAETTLGNIYFATDLSDANVATIDGIIDTLETAVGR